MWTILFLLFFALFTPLKQPKMLLKVDELERQWSIGNKWYISTGWCLADTEKMAGQKMVSRHMGNASRILSK